MLFAAQHALWRGLDARKRDHIDLAKAFITNVILKVGMYVTPLLPPPP